MPLRTYRIKGPGSRAAGLAMAFKLALKAESRWRIRPVAFVTSAELAAGS